MEDATSVVAESLRRLRTEKKLSLEQLADLSGVSKSMLGQIERGDSSPTVATLWKIANGLKISFTGLLTAPVADTTTIRRTDIKPLVEDKGKYRLFPTFPIESGRNFEIYTIEIARGGHLRAEPHGPGTQEFITVYAGELTVTINDREYRIEEGDAFRFRADCPHAYHNSGKVLTRVALVIHYRE